MDFGVTGKLGGYYLVEQYRKNVAADKNGGASFVELAAAKAAGKTVLRKCWNQSIRKHITMSWIHPRLMVSYGGGMIILGISISAIMWMILS